MQTLLPSRGFDSIVSRKKWSANQRPEPTSLQIRPAGRRLLKRQENSREFVTPRRQSVEAVGALRFANIYRSTTDKAIRWLRLNLHYRFQVVDKRLLAHQKLHYYIKNVLAALLLLRFTASVYRIQQNIAWIFTGDAMTKIILLRVMCGINIVAFLSRLAALECLQFRYVRKICKNTTFRTIKSNCFLSDAFSCPPVEPSNFSCFISLVSVWLSAAEHCWQVDFDVTNCKLFFLKKFQT